MEYQLKDSDPLALQEDDEIEEFGTEDENEETSDVFSCKYCEFQSSNIEELDDHIISHDEAILEDNYESDDEEPENLEESSKFSVSPFSKEDSIIFSQQGLKRRKQELPAFYEEYKNRNDKRVFVCPFCGYQSMKKPDMNKHLKIHSEPVELPVYVCAECPYTTRRKCDMPKHLLTHCKDGSVTMYECQYCPYATKRKGDLPKHMLCHKKPEDENLYQCHRCTYITKRRGDLRKHQLAHDTEVGGNKGVSLYNCTECGYTSKRLNDLHKHVVLHCDMAVKGIMKCKKCDYATEIGNHFARHVLSNCVTSIMGVNIFPKDPETMQDYIILEEDELHLYQIEKGNIGSVEMLEEDSHISRITRKRKRTGVEIVDSTHSNLDNYFVNENDTLEECELLDDGGEKVLVLTKYEEATE